MCVVEYFLISFWFCLVSEVVKFNSISFDLKKERINPTI